MNADIDTATASRNAFDLLRRFAPRKNQGERCELCSLLIGDTHQHLLEFGKTKIVCACDACAVLFSNQIGAKYKRIPRDARLLKDFQLSDNEWESLSIPIGLAFFFYRTSGGESPTESKDRFDNDPIVRDRTSNAKTVTALYPSPAGATECLLDLTAWKTIEDANPILRQMQPDVEALLVNRVGQAREHHLAPIDKCFELVGLIRTNWRGLSGGQEAWSKIDAFFSELRRTGSAGARQGKSKPQALDS